MWVYLRMIFDAYELLEPPCSFGFYDYHVRYPVLVLFPKTSSLLMFLYFLLSTTLGNWRVWWTIRGCWPSPNQGKMFQLWKLDMTREFILLVLHDKIIYSYQIRISVQSEMVKIFNDFWRSSYSNHTAYLWLENCSLPPISHVNSCNADGSTFPFLQKRCPTWSVCNQRQGANTRRHSQVHRFCSSRSQFDCVMFIVFFLYYYHTTLATLVHRLFSRYICNLLHVETQMSRTSYWYSMSC